MILPVVAYGDPVLKKKAVEIKQSIGAEELSRKGVSNAASAVAKISGVSKQEGSSNVYVRGLGDRYLNTTMNGLSLPSNDVNKKNINLDLKNINLEEQNEVLVKKEQTKKVEEPVVVDIKDVGLDEIKKEYELIYSSDDIELLERFINKYKDNEDVWWFVARIENKIKILKK